MAKKKLIEVALPLEKINAESSREKSIRHGHPSTLHLWWARRPLAAARAVLWASLIDDPSEHPEKFPTEAEQNAERKRLFSILELLVNWNNLNDERVLGLAKKEIEKSTLGNLPEVLDPFSGGGTIPLEAQRLGLKAHAHDLNPVAVMINKASIEIPPIFAGKAPVNPATQNELSISSGWQRATGLVEDVSYYGEWIRNKAYERLGYLYPTIKLKNNEQANVVAWIWARTVKCPNPACGCQMPLASSFTLSKKKGKEVYIEPEFDYDKKIIKYGIRKGGAKPTNVPKLARGAKFKCIMCGENTTPEYIKEEALAGRMSAQMMGIIAEGNRERLFFAPNEEHIMAADVKKPDEYPTGKLSDDRRALWTPLYGLDTFDKLFTNRQMLTMTTLSQLVHDVQPIIEQDAIKAGLPDDHIPLKNGGTGAKAYSQAVAVYLAFAVDREANYCSSQNGWSGDFIIQVFGRQGIPMVWDFAESNPFSDSTGNFMGAVKWVTSAMENLPACNSGIAEQHDAQSDCGLRNILISTDPPYYDNIGYADLSDYFYIWMRNSIRDIYPELFSTMLVPKAEELVAIPYRFDGDSGKAKAFFENGMYETCCQIYKYAGDDYPVTIYYAFKQSDSDDSEYGTQTASSGWETILNAIISAGLVITGTWPMHTERETGLKAHVNALASSIILVCRKRDPDAKVCTRRNFINSLKREMKPALQKLQNSNIAPVDLAQSAIGPGMGVFSQYSKVLESDGSPMTVRSALQIINQELDLYFNEQDGELDRESRFCVDMYSQYAFNEMKFGDADTLARAKNTSVGTMHANGLLNAEKGIVRLKERNELTENVKSDSSTWLLCQQLTKAMEDGGIESCAKIIAPMYGAAPEHAKDLAYRLYTIAERKGWAQEAYAYNALVVSWPEIQSRAAALQAIEPKQMTLFDFV